MPKPPKIGDVVHIKFHDHAENSRDVMYYETFGRISAITKLGYKLLAWGYVNEVDRIVDSNPDNETEFAIVKKAIESVRVLK